MITVFNKAMALPPSSAYFNPGYYNPNFMSPLQNSWSSLIVRDLDPSSNDPQGALEVSQSNNLSFSLWIRPDWEAGSYNRKQYFFKYESPTTEPGINNQGYKNNITFYYDHLYNSVRFKVQEYYWSANRVYLHQEIHSVNLGQTSEIGSIANSWNKSYTDYAHFVINFSTVEGADRFKLWWNGTLLTDSFNYSTGQVWPTNDLASSTTTALSFTGGNWDWSYTYGKPRLYLGSFDEDINLENILNGTSNSTGACQAYWLDKFIFIKGTGAGDDTNLYNTDGSSINQAQVDELYSSGSPADNWGDVLLGYHYFASDYQRVLATDSWHRAISAIPDETFLGANAAIASLVISTESSDDSVVYSNAELPEQWYDHYVP